MKTHQSCVGVAMVVDLLVFVHPDLGCPYAVSQGFATRVRGLFREHMTHVGAWVDLQAASALPNLADMNQSTTRILVSLSAMIQSTKAKSCRGV